MARASVSEKAGKRGSQGRGKLLVEQGFCELFREASSMQENFLEESGRHRRWEGEGDWLAIGAHDCIAYSFFISMNSGPHFPWFYRIQLWIHGELLNPLSLDKRFLWWGRGWGVSIKSDKKKKKKLYETIMCSHLDKFICFLSENKFLKWNS